MTKTLLLECEKAFGFPQSLEGLWGDREAARFIQPQESITFDWAHCALQDGRLAWEIVAYCRASGDESAVESLDSFLDADLSWPTHASISPKVPISIKKLRTVIESESTTGHNRPTSSEILAFLSVLRLWVSGLDESPAQKSLMACMDLIRAIQRAKFNNADCDVELVALARGITSAWQSYMAAALAAHGAGFIRPKHHVAATSLCNFYETVGTSSTRSSWNAYTGVPSYTPATWSQMSPLSALS